MASFSPEVLQDIRSGNDLVDVVSRYVPLKQKGGYHFGLCPFHRENSPSFSVSPDKQIFYCFGCGAGGNVISFIMRIENYGFVDAVKLLAERIHYAIPEQGHSEDYQKQRELKNTLFDMHKIAARFFYDNLQEPGGSLAVEYLNKRALTAAIRKKFGLGYSGEKKDALFQHLLEKGFDIDTIVKSGLAIADKRGSYFDRFSNRLMFPIFNEQSKIVGFGGRLLTEDKQQAKYLNSPETPIFEKSRNLYGIQVARLAKKEEILLVEGYMDVLALCQHGFLNTVAALGTAFNQEHTRLLKKYAKQVVILFDSDQAGEKAALRAISVLKTAGLYTKVLQLKDAKDPDEFLKRFGPQAFWEALQQAQNAPLFQVNCIKAQFDLSLPEQTIQFTKEAAKVVANIENAVEREVYLKDIAKSTSLSETAIQKEVDAFVDPQADRIMVQPYRNKPSVMPTKQNTKGVDEARRHLLFVLAMHETLSNKLLLHLQDYEFVEPVYQKLFNILKQKRQKNEQFVPADLANEFETWEEQQVVSAIFTVTFALESEETLTEALNQQIFLCKEAYINHAFTLEMGMEQLILLTNLKKNLKKSYI